MKKAPRPICRWTIGLWLCVTAGTASAQLCQLEVHGESIAGLVLLDEEGKQIELADPGPVVSLPPGRYGLYEIRLQDGYFCGRYGLRGADWFTVAPKKPYKLEIGAPLRPTVKVRRLGRNLTLDYGLRDAAGRFYRRDTGDNLPQFSIRQGGREIHAGSFEDG